MSRAWSPARALAWESLRLSWRPVVGATLATCALAAIYRRLLAPLGDRRDAVVFSSLLLTLAIVYAATPLSCRDDGVGLGFDRRLFRLPLRTPLLVLARLLPALLLVAAMHTALAAFMRAAFGAPWPLLGPGLLAIAVASWSLALSWTCARRPLLIAPLGVVLLLALLSWMRPVLRVDPLWSRLTARDAAILVLALTSSALVAWWGVARSRHAGTAAPSPPRRLVRLPDRVFARRQKAAVATAVEVARLPSAMRGQLWMEWREKGRWVPFGALLCLVLIAVASSIRTFDGAGLLEKVLHDYLPFTLLMVPPIAGFLHGTFRLSSRQAGVDSFRATRPLGDRELAHAVLLSALRTGAAGWTAAFAGVALLAFGLWRFGADAGVEKLLGEIGVAVAGIGAGRMALATSLFAAGAWAALGTVAAIALCGRSWLSAAAYVLPLGAVAVVMVADFAGVDLFRAGPALIAPFGVLLPLAAAAAWTLAVRAGLISPLGALVAALAWGAGTVLLLRLLPMLFPVFLAAGEPLPRWLLLLAPALTAGIVLPLALAPIALRWNRHR